jgi:uncharacterized membrane protein YphA (DoxX/SURF4 family)
MNQNQSGIFPFSIFPAPSFQWLYFAVRFILGLIFISSGAIKLVNPQSFSIIIDAYGLIPEAAVFPAALAVAGLEVLAGAGLLLDVQGSLETIAALLLFFVLILGYGLWLGLDVDCGCFGPNDPEAKAFHGLRAALYRDMVMMLGVGFAFFWRRRQMIRPLRLGTVYMRIYGKQKNRRNDV